jgi:hypothetical protein
VRATACSGFLARAAYSIYLTFTMDRVSNRE